MNKTIYMDIDSCFVEVMPRIRQLWNMHYASDGEFADDNNQSWNMGLPQSQVEEIFSMDCFYDTLEPEEECVKVLRELKKFGYKIIAFSKCSYDNVCSKTRLIKRQSDLFDGFIFVDLNFDKGLVDMSDGLTVFIEDSPENLYSSNAKYKVLNQCYGKKGWQDGHNLSHVIFNWDELLRLVTSFELYENIIAGLK